MAFIDERFPTDISYGFTGGPEYHTTIADFMSGYDDRNQDWAQPKHSWSFSEDVKKPEQMEEIRRFFRSVAKGRFNSFRFKDWEDYLVTITNGRLDTTGAGTGVPTLQMYKRYVFGSSTDDRKISKPRSGTVTVYRNAGAVTVGGSAGNIAINYLTGEVTFVADDSEAITGHTVGASHQFTTATDITGLTTSKKVYITGTAGTAATLLNGLAHTITAKTGSGPYTWTISTTTTGLTVTTNGTALAYPQASDALTWAGEFDVPCRLDVDKLDSTVDDFGTRSWSDVPIVEDKNHD